MINTQKNAVTKVSCPECDTPLNLPGNLILGKITECLACGTENELISINPLKIAPLEEEK